MLGPLVWLKFSSQLIHRGKGAIIEMKCRAHEQ
jgi:hypothetical protein